MIGLLIPKPLKNGSETRRNYLMSSSALTLVELDLLDSALSKKLTYDKP